MAVEYEAMERFGLSEKDYYDCDRITRAGYVGYVYGKNAIETMLGYEARKKAEAKAKEARKKGKRR